MKNKEELSFSLNANIYSFESILGAAYSFLDRAYIFLDGDPKKNIKVVLKLKKESSGLNPESLKGEFLNELLGQSLRLKLAKDNKKIQEYIVGQALFGASPEQAQSENVNEDDELDKILERELKALEEEEKNAAKDKKDPLGVLTSWDEKGVKKSKAKKKK